METVLTDIEARVLGSLMEKALSTPEYYPLSLNALTNACNQKSSRDPVTDFPENAVQQAADALIQKGLAHLSLAARVPKYEELLTRQRTFVPRESAVLAVLLLRGAQTAGEIRGRTARMCEFESLEEVLSTLADLEGWGLVRRLDRQAGRKEPRFRHALGMETLDDAAPLATENVEPAPDRIAALEARVSILEETLEEMRAAFRDFRAQFE